jgi:hypothetical protein
VVKKIVRLALPGGGSGEPDRSEATEPTAAAVPVEVVEPDRVAVLA